MSPTRRQLLAGIFSAATVAALPDLTKAARVDVTPCRVIVIAMPEGLTAENECNSLLNLQANGDVTWTRLTTKTDPPTHRIYTGSDSFTMAELIDRLREEADRARSNPS